MAFTGPSKEELENYFRNSRQYFDELAKYYQQSDPEYYNEFIAPFYNNPFRMASAGRSGSAARGIVLIGIMIALIAAGAAAFFIVSETETDSDEPVTKKTERVISKRDNASVDTTSIEHGDIYEKAMNYYYEKDYENAEKYFKLVPRSNKNYPDAVRKLKRIKEMKD
ncbi:MAG: hypothetical protein EHM58_17375 [Ignavibacteriae bacterium]|nr:MAG: hypothetical protein EHM58_17375 [Ignavibacteriota bacterium]